MKCKFKRLYKQQMSKKEVRQILLKRQKGKCVRCGEPLKGDLSIDHRQPLSRGGTWLLSNLQLMHAKCNNEKGNKIEHGK